MAFSGPSRGVKNDINVTPLVDVVLVLLIIFMVVTPMLQRDKEVHLPKTRSSDENKKPDALTVSLPPDHTIWFESRQLSAEALTAKVADTLLKDPTRKVLIKGDESLKVKDVRAVMVAAKAGGAKGVSFAVEELKQ
jgi:biopolymer transport protein TolR